MRVWRGSWASEPGRRWPGAWSPARSQGQRSTRRPSPSESSRCQGGSAEAGACRPRLDPTDPTETASHARRREPRGQQSVARGPGDRVSWRGGAADTIDFSRATRTSAAVLRTQLWDVPCPRGAGPAQVAGARGPAPPCATRSLAGALHRTLQAGSGRGRSCPRRWPLASAFGHLIASLCHVVHFGSLFPPSYGENEKWRCTWRACELLFSRQACWGCLLSAAPPTPQGDEGQAGRCWVGSWGLRRRVQLFRDWVPSEMWPVWGKSCPAARP